MPESIGALKAGCATFNSEDLQDGGSALKF